MINPPEILENGDPPDVCLGVLLLFFFFCLLFVCLFFVFCFDFFKYFLWEGRGCCFRGQRRMQGPCVPLWWILKFKTMQKQWFLIVGSWLRLGLWAWVNIQIKACHYSSFAPIIKIGLFGPYDYIWRALCASHNCTLLKVYSSIIPRPSRSLLSRCWNIIHVIVSLRERPSDTCCHHSHDQDAVVAFKTFFTNQYKTRIICWKII